MSMRIQVFGPLTVVAGDVVVTQSGFHGRKPRQVLQILAAHGGRAVSKDRLVDLLWNDEPPGDPGGAVEHYVALLRRGLHGRGRTSETVVQTEGAGYRLDLERTSLDLVEFSRAVEDVATWLHLDRVREALRVSESDIFVDEPYAPWAMDIRDVVRRQRCDLLVRAAELGLAQGDTRSAIRDATEAIDREPHLESAYRVLMCAHYVRGDQARALDTFQQCRQKLDDDLGIVPTSHTRDLYQAVLCQSSAEDVHRRLVVPQGLRSA
jgi:SARP family transcriptional regulator, regulator of embCAB operon